MIGRDLPASGHPNAGVRTVVHVSEAELNVQGGMGRVAVEWKQAFERRGIAFHHFGPARVGAGIHRALWHRAALAVVRQSGLKPQLVLAHEPVGLAMRRFGVRTAVFSHGMERRGAEVARCFTVPGKNGLARIRRVVADALLWRWRLRQCDEGIRRCDLFLASNGADAELAERYYGRRAEDIFLFRNGVDLAGDSRIEPVSMANVLFYASWLPRKGIQTLISAVRILRGESLRFRIITCTGENPATVQATLPDDVKDIFEIVPAISREREKELFLRCGIFVLPSLSEGQPLTLLQGLAYGRCCVASAIPGHVDVVKHGISGLLFPAGDASGLAATLRTALTNPALCLQLGQAAAQSMCDRSWPAVTDELVDRLLRVPNPTITNVGLNPFEN